jgi:diamine N-acetyltransferase
MTEHEYFIIGNANPADAEGIAAYYTRLGEATRKRFAPHGFEAADISSLLNQPEKYSIQVAEEKGSGRIIAYAITMTGVFDYDEARWQQYAILLTGTAHGTYAPSVADEWQGRGLGQLLFNFTVSQLKQKGLHEIILWGGVQCSNVRAVNFYLKNNFLLKGYFEYQGGNYDMMKVL